MSEGSGVASSWHELLDQLTRHFGNVAQHRCLLWIDPARADPFEGNDLVEQSRVRVPIRHPRFDPSRAPYVVPLDLSRSADVELFKSSVELAWLSWRMDYLHAMQGQPICGWVNAGNAKSVARHWSAHCHLHMFQRQTRLLRFQDPGVREWLWPTLSRTQQQAMLGPASELFAMGRTQQLIHHRAAGTVQKPSSQDELARIPALRLEHAQWSQVDDYATLHAAWRTWRNSTGEAGTACRATGWEKGILRALAHASSLGIRDAADRELFALHALRLGPEFYRNPSLEHIWQKTLEGDFYGSAVEAVTWHPADQLAIQPIAS